MKTNSTEENIEKRQLDKLNRLKGCCEQIIKCAESTLRKIDSQGIEGNYSCNHDVEKWSERIHRVSYELWLLKDVRTLVSQEEKIAVEVKEDQTLDDNLPEKNDWTTTSQGEQA